MHNQYTKKAAKAVELAQKVAKALEHSYVGTEHLLLGLMREKTGVAAQVLKSNGVEESQVLDLMDQLITPPGSVGLMEPSGTTPKLQHVLDMSRMEAESLQEDAIGTEHLLIAILKEPDCIATRLLVTLNVNPQKLYMDILTAIGEDLAKHKDDFQRAKTVHDASATPVLNQYSKDLTEAAAQGKLDNVVGRDSEIERVIQILSRRTKNNPCLIGEPGVGKTAIAEGLASRIAKDDVPDSVRDKRVVVLDLASMVAGSKYRGEFEERIKRVIKEVSAEGNILLFLDEIHTIIGAGGAEGAIDAANILKPSLARGEIQIIGATTINEYRKHIEKDPALERRFQPVMVEEPSEEEAIQILMGIKGHYEAHHHIEITEEAVEAAVKLSKRYINDRYLPDKAIDLMDEAAARLRLSGYQKFPQVEEIEKQLASIDEEREACIIAQDFDKAGELTREKKQLEAELAKWKKKRTNNKNLKVEEEQIAEIVAMWTKIPVNRIAEEESSRLRRLEKTLHKRVIAQEDAVSAVAKAIKRGRVGLKDPNRPIGSFLFLGPTGVGKTELSKAVAEAVFGKEDAIIRVDMSEYMEKHSVSKIIGSPPGYVGFDEGGQLSEKVRRNPYSVVLFDEIEKAHPDVFNILLQVLDDGHITDSQGRKVSFKNTIIIMTSNAGAQSIISPKKLGFASVEDEKVNYENMRNNVMDEVKRIFKPEFINRIDEIIVFHTLNKEHMKQIVSLLLKTVAERCYTQLQIRLTFREPVKKYLVDVGSDEKYGARPLRRAVQTKIEDALAEEILAKRIKSGDNVTVGVAKNEVTFTVNKL